MEDLRQRILQILEENDGLSISDVARALEIHYTTASKYLAVMEAEQKISHRNIGMAKFFVTKKNIMPTMIKAALVLFVLSFILVPSLAMPSKIPVNGRLSYSNESLVNSTANFTFNIYDASIAGNSKWTEQQNLTVVNGAFSALLGNNTQLNLSFDENYFLEISVNGEIISPRFELGTVPYAQTANQTSFLKNNARALGNVLPDANNSFSIGSDSLRWKNGSFINIDASGTVNASEFWTGNVNIGSNLSQLNTLHQLLLSRQAADNASVNSFISTKLNDSDIPVCFGSSKLVRSAAGQALACDPITQVGTISQGTWTSSIDTLQQSWFRNEVFFAANVYFVNNSNIYDVNQTDLNVNGTFSPYFSNMFDLGNETLLWRNIYAVTLNATSTLVVGNTDILSNLSALDIRESSDFTSLTNAVSAKADSSTVSTLQTALTNLETKHNADNISVTLLANSKAVPGNCAPGQVVQNTTTGGVQCISSGGVTSISTSYPISGGTITTTGTIGFDNTSYQNLDVRQAADNASLSSLIATKISQAVLDAVNNSKANVTDWTNTQNNLTQLSQNVSAINSSLATQITKQANDNASIQNALSVKSNQTDVNAINASLTDSISRQSADNTTLSNAISGKFNNSGGFITGNINVTGFVNTTNLYASRAGIGTLTPNTTLHVKGPSGTFGGIIVDTTTSSAQAHVNFWDNGIPKWALYKTTDNSIAFYDETAKTNRFLIDSSGRLGLGVTPTSTLTLGGDVTFFSSLASTFTIQTNTPDTSGSNLKFVAGNGVTDIMLNGGNGGSIQIQAGTGGAATDRDTTAGNGGKISILAGTGGAVSNGASPGVAADVEIIAGSGGTGDNTNGGNVYITGGNSSGSGLQGNVLLAINSSGVARGNVAIGTSSPVEKLDVRGNVNVSGTINATQLFIARTNVLTNLSSLDIRQAADNSTLTNSLSGKANVTDWTNTQNNLSQLSQNISLLNTSARNLDARQAADNTSVTALIGTKSSAGNCAAGQAVQNTTTGGVQCIAVSGASYNQTLNTTSNVTFGRITVSPSYESTAATTTTNIYTLNNGGSVNWSTEFRAASSDDQYASVALAAGQQSHHLLADNFGFSIPDDAIITGVQVDVEEKATGTIQDIALSLIKSNVDLWFTDFTVSDNWPATDTWVSHGNSTDLIGLDWTPRDINSPGFGVRIVAYAPIGGGGGTAYVDSIRMTVTYMTNGNIVNASRLLVGMSGGFLQGYDNTINGNLYVSNRLNATNIYTAGLTLSGALGAAEVDTDYIGPKTNAGAGGTITFGSGDMLFNGMTVDGTTTQVNISRLNVIGLGTMAFRAGKNAYTTSFNIDNTNNRISMFQATPIAKLNMLTVNGSINSSAGINTNSLNVTLKSNFTGLAEFYGNVSIRSVSGGTANISGITMYNESNRAWCVRVTGQGTLQAIEGGC